jgi:hypothetical protein
MVLQVRHEQPGPSRDVQGVRDGPAMMPVVVSFYTPSYKAWAEYLLASCIGFGLDHEIEARYMPASWDWRRRCAVKGPYMLWALHRHAPRPILWIDADSEIKGQLTLFDDPPFDLAFARTAGGNVRSGTVYAGPAAGPILRVAAELCRAFPELGHERNLHTAVSQTHTGARIQTLDAGYNRVPDQILPEGSWAGVMYIEANGRSHGGGVNARRGKETT